MAKEMTATILAGCIEMDTPDTIVEWVTSISSCIMHMCSHTSNTILDKAFDSLADVLENIIKQFEAPDDMDDDINPSSLFKPVEKDFYNYITLENIIQGMDKLFPIYERAVSLLRYDYGNERINDIENQMGLSLIQFYVYCLNVFFGDYSDLITQLFLAKGVVIPDNDIRNLMQQASVATKSVMLKRKFDMHTECNKIAKAFFEDMYK